MGEAPQQNSDAVRTAAATAATPDAVTAAILEKHAAGQSLTPQESGRLGWWRMQLNRLTGKTGSAAGSVPGQAQPAAPVRKPVHMEPVPTSSPSNDGVAVVPVDAALAMRTAAILINRGDAFAVGLVERHARNAGATGETYNRLVAAAGLSKDDKRLIVDFAPDVCNELGIDPRQCSVLVVAGVLGMHVVNLWQAIGELKEIARERQAPDLAGADNWTHTTVDAKSPGTGQPVSTRPTTPRGAPPEVK